MITTPDAEPFTLELIRRRRAELRAELEQMDREGVPAAERIIALRRVARLREAERSLIAGGVVVWEPKA